MISFVIPAYDEATEIGACLDAIAAAGHAAGRDFEMVVADDASTDDTAAIAAAHGARVVAVNKRHIAATRNAGAAETRGEVLIFVDADTQVTPAAVQGALAALDDGAVGGGSKLRVRGPLPWPARWLVPFMTSLYHLTGWAAGCFVYCTRADFEAIGGFDERYYASEEIHFSRALKKRGPFKVVRGPVLTSGRKFRLYGPGETLQTVFRLLFGGLGSVRRREGLEVWYDGRREGPSSGAASRDDRNS